MTGLTAKVFRTYNASWTMANLLRDMKLTGSIAEKVVDYNEANRRVAILCNHKRTVAAAHETQMEKLGDRIKGLKYQKWRVKQMMLDIDPAIKKKNGAEYFELDDDLDQEWILEHQSYLVEEQRQKIEKKFNKENEKQVAEGGKEMKHKELEERMEAADDLAKKFKKENKLGKVVAEGKGPTIEKCKATLEKLDQRIQNMLFQAKDKENNKEVALGTSKIVGITSSGFRLRILLTDTPRTISTRVSQWCFRRNSVCLSKGSSPRLYERNLFGRSNQLTRIGSSRKRHCQVASTKDLKYCKRIVPTWY
jgi:DNA topoisomerase-1